MKKLRKKKQKLDDKLLDIVLSDPRYIAYEHILFVENMLNLSTKPNDKKLDDIINQILNDHM
jgi:hypothetical protein